MCAYRALVAALVFLALIATDVPSNSEEKIAPSRENGDGETTITVLDHRDVLGVLGKEVRGKNDENMGRIIDVIADQGGQVKAAIIDFGGFLGVGNRKVAVAWNALRFSPNAKRSDPIGLELTLAQVQAAPQYRADKPVVIVGALSSLQSSLRP